MAIFKREEIYEELTNEQVLERMLDALYDDYEDWHVLKFKNAPYDLLLIKTFAKSVTRYISPSNPNPTHKEKLEDTQMVIAVTVDVERGDSHDHLFDKTKSWTSSHIVTDNVRGLIRVLRDIDRDNK